MKKALKLTDQQALDLYKTANDEWKKILEDNYGKDFFKPKEVTDLVNDIYSLAEYLNLDDIDDLFIYDKDTKDPHERFINACNILSKVSKIYNNGKLITSEEWKNPRIEKYCPYKYFSFGRGSVGFRSWHTYLHCPFGFYLREQKHAEAHYNNFKKYWEDYWAVKS